MIKLKDCKVIADASKDFDQFELYFDIITYTDNKQLNKIYNNIKFYNTIQLQSKHYTDKIAIIHNSSKKANIIQISYFDKFGAIRDIERSTLKDALKEVYKDYSVKEVA